MLENQNNPHESHGGFVIGSVQSDSCVKWIKKRECYLEIMLQNFLEIMLQKLQSEYLFMSNDAWFRLSGYVNSQNTPKSLEKFRRYTQKLHYMVTKLGSSV